MIKLLVIIHSLKGGGAERVVINLLKGLDRDKFSITLVLYERILDFPLPNKIEVEILNIYAGKNIFTLGVGFIRKIIHLSGLIRKAGPDIVFSLLSSTNVTVILAKLFSGIHCKVIISEHTHPSLNLKNERFGWITKLFMRYVYPYADTIIAVSGGIKNDLLRDFHLPDNKIVVIYNPADLKEIQIRSRETADHQWFHDDIPVIISVGRLTKQKGYPYLIKAFSLARRSLPCRLMILGEGEDKERLIAMARKLGIARDVEFLGFRENPFPYMAKASLFVLSSLYEGFGNVIVEAMALGLPVISTDCPSGPSEIIDDKKNGILVPVQDEYSIARAITEVLTNKALREHLGMEAKRKSEVFALEKIMKDYGRVFSENSSYSV
jgi:glycosyltransferase involved in cell wall biosynthesis